MLDLDLHFLLFDTILLLFFLILLFQLSFLILQHVQLLLLLFGPFRSIPSFLLHELRHLFLQLFLFIPQIINPLLLLLNRLLFLINHSSQLLLLVFPDSQLFS